MIPKYHLGSSSIEGICVFSLRIMMVEFTKVFLFLRDCVPIVRGLALVVKTC